MHGRTAHRNIEYSFKFKNARNSYRFIGFCGLFSTQKPSSSESRENLSRESIDILTNSDPSLCVYVYFIVLLVECMQWIDNIDNTRTIISKMLQLHIATKWKQLSRKIFRFNLGFHGIFLWPNSPLFFCFSYALCCLLAL